MQSTPYLNAKILVVDDETANVWVLERALTEWGYQNVKSTIDPREVLGLFTEFAPDLVVLDLMMPYLDGFQVMEQIVPLIPEGTYLPILVLTADITRESKRRALSAGARDFLTKPVDFTELLLRVGNLLETRSLHLQLQDQNRTLEERVTERTRELETAQIQIMERNQELEEAQVEILERLARAAEYRDDDTGEHIHRVSENAYLTARLLGVPEDEAELIRRAAPLHDVGKIGVPDHILLKPGKLTPDEFQQMKTHAAVGAALLSNGHSDLVKTAEQIALTHHERWDGSGYPRGLAGEEIPLVSRIVAVADVFDALTHARPYKAAWSEEDALAEITDQSGRHFDPRVVLAFLQLHPAS